MTLDVRGDRKVIILFAINPDAIIVTVVDRRLEKGRHVALVGRVALVVLADAATLKALVHALLPRLPEVGVAADRVVPRDVALDGEGVAVHEGHVAVCGPRAWEETFELGAARAWVGFGADVHGAAGGVAVGHADLAAS